MAETNVRTIDGVSITNWAAAAFAEVTTSPNSLLAKLTGPQLAESSVEARLRGETSPAYPIVQITDLQKKAGDTVVCEMVNMMTGKPVAFGDESIQGKLKSQSFQTQSVKIDQFVVGASAGGRMSQQRTNINIPGTSRAGMTGWAQRYMTQQALVHAAGARGSDNGDRWHVPLESDGDFTKCMVNSVLPPTFNRHFYAGKATSLATLTSASILNFDAIENALAQMEDSGQPLPSCTIEGDSAAGESPLWVLYMTNRQSMSLRRAAGEGTWAQYQKMAMNRGKDNPLFTGALGLYKNVLMKEYPFPIRFAANAAVTVSQNAAAATTTTSTPTVTTDRALLFRAQAVANCYGAGDTTGLPFDVWAGYPEAEHGRKWECSMAGIGGFSKFRFPMSYGSTKNYLTDYGVAVIDSYAPATV